jgi:hypothetical protein
MNNQFDELTKSLAQSVTRRGAMKKFGVGLAGLALAAFGLPNRAEAATLHGYCEVFYPRWGGPPELTGRCISPLETGYCRFGDSSDCKGGANANHVAGSPCGGAWGTNKKCSFSA